MSIGNPTLEGYTVTLLFGIKQQRTLLKLTVLMGTLGEDRTCKCLATFSARCLPELQTFLGARGDPYEPL